MKVSVFGLGYVGAVSCACFSKLGHEVIGVDISEQKARLINEGKSPIVEKDLDELIAEGIGNGKLRATTNAREAILNTDLSLICVGTPSQITGAIDLSYIYRVCQEIGEILTEKSTFHTIAIRSTIIPGTVRECVQLVKEISSKTTEHFAVVSNPEFLREGTAVFDFWNPPYTVIGVVDGNGEQEMSDLYRGVEAPFYTLKAEESEMMKYANNSFHAMKITFANEIGNICKELGVDSHKVMELVSKDTKLNLSPYYLKPGFAYGGSCLPKDVRGLTYRSRQLDLKSPLLESLNVSNEYQVNRGLNLILKTGKKKVGFLGFSFKAGTDDLRESPLVTLIESLIGKGYDLALYDSNILLSKLTGKNRDYLTGHIPHVSRLLKESPEEVIDASEVIVIGNKGTGFADLVDRMPADKKVIDLVRVASDRTTKDNYEGICW